MIFAKYFSICPHVYYISIFNWFFYFVAESVCFLTSPNFPPFLVVELEEKILTTLNFK